MIAILRSQPFWTCRLGKSTFASVVDHVGVGPEIERYNDVLHDVTRKVLTNFGIAQMLDLNA